MVLEKVLGLVQACSLLLGLVQVCSLLLLLAQQEDFRLVVPPQWQLVQLEALL
jgi:hypothetical protein